MSLARTVLHIAPLERRLADPVCLSAIDGETSGAGAAGTAADRTAIGRMFVEAGLREPRWSDQPVGGGGRGSASREVFDRAISRAIEATDITDLDRGDPADAVGLARGGSARGATRAVSVAAADGGQICAYIGTGDGPGLVFIGAPGMPIELHDGWIRRLADDFRVATWETRGLFGPMDGEPPGLGLDSQVDDALATIERAGFDRYHLVGLCGGASIALALAAVDDRLASMSLWFGDFEVGRPDLKTEHQINLQAVMEVAASGRASPEAVHSILVKTMVDQSVPALAPLTLYPFATPELLARYCGMNLAVMTTDVLGFEPQRNVSALVATTSSDRTAHPGASKLVAAAIDAEELDLRTSCHLDAFVDSDRWASLASTFHLEHNE